jgi:RNA polymerase sigma factor (sigma-70 family)
VRDCLDGRPDAWSELVDRYERLVYSVPRRCGLGEADADDVLQSVFTMLFRKLESLRDHDRLASWLLTTAYRESWRVSRRRGPVYAPDAAGADPVMPSAPEIQRQEHQHLVRQALRMLGGRDAALLSALFNSVGDPSYEAIARELGMSVGSIGPTRARAFRKLEKILRELGFDPDVLDV